MTKNKKSTLVDLLTKVADMIEAVRRLAAAVEENTKALRETIFVRPNVPNPFEPISPRPMPRPTVVMYGGDSSGGTGDPWYK